MGKSAAAMVILVALTFLPPAARAQATTNSMGMPEQGMQMMMLGAIVGGAVGYFVAAEEVSGVLVGAVIGGAFGHWWHRAGERFQAGATPPRIAYPSDGGAPLRLINLTEHGHPALRVAIPPNVSD